jgi:hypothetical protein
MTLGSIVTRLSAKEGCTTATTYHVLFTQPPCCRETFLLTNHCFSQNLHSHNKSLAMKPL